MANRNRNTVKTEAIIESCRSEAKWQKVIELAEELKTGSPIHGNIFDGFSQVNLKTIH